MIGKPEQDAFVNAMKWASVTTLRKDGSPSASIVFYMREGDDLLFSTTKGRLKAKTIANDARVAFTILDEGAPYRYLTVEGTATIEEHNLVPAHIKINEVMRGAPFTPPPGFEERLKADGRVIIRIKPGRVSGVVNRG
jgi:PPOX class probable F420-dependent enzyme